MKAFIKEPLVHFLLIGAVLFLIFKVYDDPAGSQSSQIIITDGQIEFLKANYARTRQRTPSKEEEQGLIDNYLREEILYREALALGFDKDDSVVRNRLRQKMDLMSDELAGIAVPTDAQLQQFLKNNSEKFRTEPQIAFRHIFIDIAHRGIAAEDEAERILSLLSDEGDRTNPETLGDRLMQPQSFGLTRVSEIAKLFGKPFILELTKLTPGQWTGPIQSGYGLHLILVSDYVADSLPQLDEIRGTVEWEWSAANKKELKENIYNELRKKYTVEFERSENGVRNSQTVSTAQAAQEEQQ
jgi:hypothetical protein